MADLTVENVQTSIPDLAITGSSHPNEDEVLTFIANRKAELTGLLVGYGAEWPAAGSAAESYLRSTWLIGVELDCYNTRYDVTASGAEPAEIERLSRDWENRLNRLSVLARAITAGSGASTGGGGVPLAYSSRQTGVGAASFAQYTADKHRRELWGFGWRWTGSPFVEVGPW